MAVTTLVVSTAVSAHAVPIDWVTVGDPGNAADTNPSGYGAVAEAFQIMKFEWTNSQYAEFLNAVDPQGTNPNSIYSASMGSDARGGITLTPGNDSGTKYSTKANMGDKPVNFVSWFDAARVANWLHNGSQAYGTSDASADAPQNFGAYTLGTGTSGNAPAKNSDAKFYIPTENQWFKAAYYKGSGTNAGYWDYATMNDTAPTPVTSGSTGIGLAGGTGNFANYLNSANWNGQTGNVTTVGTNGGPSAYDIYDQSGNLWEWNDLDGTVGASRGIRGGSWGNNAFNMSSSFRLTFAPSEESNGFGFRLASPVPVPEPTAWAMGLAGVACGGYLVRRRRVSVDVVVAVDIGCVESP